jgi:hypothetical protein
MPPRAIPSALRTTVGVPPTSVTSMRGAVAGAVTVVIHDVSARRAAFATMCIGPLLIGTPQSSALAFGPTRCASACAVPATSHSRKCPLSGCRAAYELRMLATSVSVWMSSTGVLIGAEDGRRTADRSGDVRRTARRDERQPDRARLCTKKPSKACARGCTPLKYETSANADCDSPAAMSRFGRNPPRPARSEAPVRPG